MMTKMPRFLLLGALLVGWGGWARAAEAAKGSPSSPVKDLCQDCVDPYNPGAERGRFFKAAGADNELDAKEFETDKARADGFVRTFDTWAGMLAFDKNQGKTIDWFEADAYRRDVRNRVLGAHDADKDGQLAGAERDAANLALAGGKLPAAPKPSDAPKVIPVRRGTSEMAGGVIRPPTRTEPLVVRGGGGGGAEGPIIVRPGGGQLSEEARLRMFDKNKDGKLDEAEKAAMAKWDEDAKKRREEWARTAAKWRQLYQELLKKHDKNGDGRINEDERKPYYEEYRQRSRIMRWDKDGDGQLSDPERAEMEQKEAEWKKRSEESRRKWMLQRWDKDKDGQLGDEEKAAMEAQQAEWKKQADQRRKEYEQLRKKHDRDADGKLDEAERKAYYEEIQSRWRLRRWDKNKDGRLDDAERKAMEAEQAEWRKKGEEARRMWELRRWDKNKDGQLDEAERKTMEEERAKWRRPVSMMINGRPVDGGGMTVWESEDGRVRAVMIARPPDDPDDR